MQKLDLRNNLKELIDSLNSREITSFVENTGANINSTHVLRLLLNSKAGFDRALFYPEKQVIMKEFRAVEFYETNYFSDVVTFLSPARNMLANDFLANSVFNRFYLFHKSLLFSFQLIDNLLLPHRELFQEDTSFVIDKLPGKGILMLQLIDEDDIGLGKLIKVLTSISDLVGIINVMMERIDKEGRGEEATIILIDSGTDINISVKLPEKAAEIIAKLLEEFWNLIVNRKYVENKKNVEMIQDSVTALRAIKEAEDNKVIDRESAELWRRGIVDNTEKILLNNTLTKSIIVQQNEVSNRQLLLEQSSRFQLTDGKKDGDEIKKG